MAKGSKYESAIVDIRRTVKLLKEHIGRLPDDAEPEEILRTANSIGGQLVSLRGDAKKAIIMRAMGD
jgi:hypothetical protein